MRYVAVEFSADAADNRPLGRSGSYLRESEVTEADIAYFTTEAEAERAIATAPNKRAGCKAEIIGSNKKVTA